tara:strand:+ start:21 stop:512 length:492 start_codon:yes stop_codon:yes gene_type:complete
MHVLIKKNHLVLKDYKIKCAVGKRGIGKKKREGDLITPKGIFKIKKVYYRKDRVKNLITKIKKVAIKKDMGWCDDPKSLKYNKSVKFPFKYKSEKLFRTDNIYDIIIVLNFNMNPTIKNKGSAIFIHVAKNNLSPTKGCIAIKKKELKKILKFLTTRTKIEIS